MNGFNLLQNSYLLHNVLYSYLKSSAESINHIWGWIIKNRLKRGLTENLKKHLQCYIIIV